MGMRQTYVDTSNLSGRTVAGTLRRLLYYVGLHRRHIGIAFVALSLASLLNMVPPWALKIAVDDFIPQKDAAGAVRIAGAMMLIYLARAALNYLNFYLFARSSQTIVYQVSRDMFVRLVRHSMRFFESQRTGETVSHLTADVTAVQQAMQGQVLTASAGIVTMLLYLVVMLTLDWRLTLVILSVVPLMLIASIITARMLRVRYRRVQESIANINTAIEENVSGVRVSRAFAREEADARRFQTENRANLQANLNTTMVESIATPVIEGLSTLSVAALLAYGGWQITIGEMQPGTLIAFLAYVQIFHQPMTELVRVNYVIQSGLAAADRIFQFMDVPRHIVDRPSAVDLVQPRGRVEFRNVDFSYDGTTPVLQDVSVTAEPGQTVALVGATGSGKTTMVNLIARFYDPTVRPDPGRRYRSPRSPHGKSPLAPGLRAPGDLPVQRHHRREHPLRGPRGRRQPGRRRGRPGSRRRIHRGVGRRLRNRRRRWRPAALARPAAARGVGPRHPRRPRRTRAGRSHLRHRHRIRIRDSAGPGPGHAQPHQLRHRPPPLHHPQRRPHRRPRRRPHRPARKPTPNSSPNPAPTATSTPPNSTTHPRLRRGGVSGRRHVAQAARSLGLFLPGTIPTSSAHRTGRQGPVPNPPVFPAPQWRTHHPVGCPPRPVPYLVGGGPLWVPAATPNHPRMQPVGIPRLEVLSLRGPLEAVLGQGQGLG